MQPNEQKVLTAEQVAAKVKRADDAIEATQYDVWYPGYGDGSFHCSNPSPHATANCALRDLNGAISITTTILRNAK